MKTGTNDSEELCANVGGHINRVWGVEPCDSPPPVALSSPIVNIRFKFEVEFITTLVEGLLVGGYGISENCLIS